jgi:hypothetical protein
MDKVIEKVAFNFLIAQVAPAVALMVIVAFLNALACGASVAAAFSGVLNWSVQSDHLIMLFCGAVPLGLCLWALETTSVANLESFSKTFLGDDNKWSPKASEDLRPRSSLRKAVVKAWSQRPVLILIVLSPLILAFELISIFAACAHHLYKLSAFLHGPKVENEVYLSAINDLSYASYYFADMAIALFVAAIAALVLWARSGDFRLGEFAGILYLACAVHYLFGRLLKTAFDRAVDPQGSDWRHAFTPEDVALGRANKDGTR